MLKKMAINDLAELKKPITSNYNNQSIISNSSFSNVKTSCRCLYTF